MRTIHGAWVAELVLLAILAPTAPVLRADDAEAIKIIQEKGGKVVIDEQGKHRPVVEIYLNKKTCGDAELALVKRFKYLRMLDLGGAPVTDTGLEEIAGLMSLDSLNLHETKVTSAGLKHLANLRSLRKIDLYNSEVSDAVLRELRAIGLLHALVGACNRAGTRPASGADVTSIDLSSDKVTHVGLRELADFKSLNLLNITDAQVTDAALCALREIGLLHALLSASGRNGQRPTSAANVVYLKLTGPRLTDAGLKELVGLTSLATLDMSRTSIVGDGLKELARFKSLRTLQVSPQLTDAGLRELAGHESLQELDLSQTKVTDAGQKELARLKTLQTLTVSPQLTDSGLKELARLKALRSLDLRGTHVTPAGLKALAGLKLHTLDVSSAQVTDETLRVLREIDLLHALTHAVAKGTRPTSPTAVLWFRLTGTQVTDAGLRELVGLKSLQTLYVRGTRVTDQGIAELKKTFPDLQIIR